MLAAVQGGVGVEVAIEVVLFGKTGEDVSEMMGHMKFQ